MTPTGGTLPVVTNFILPFLPGGGSQVTYQSLIGNSPVVPPNTCAFTSIGEGDFNPRLDREPRDRHRDDVRAEISAVWDRVYAENAELHSERERRDQFVRVPDVLPADDFRDG